MGQPPASDPPWARSGSREEEEEESPPPAEERAPEPPTPPAPPAPPVQAKADRPNRPKEKSHKRYVLAATQALRDGDSEAEIRSWLGKKGVASKRIDQIIIRARARAHRDIEEMDEVVHDADLHAERQKHMTRGALWFAGGALLTLFTFTSASTSGGTYIVAWGPMIYGLIRMVRARTR